MNSNILFNTPSHPFSFECEGKIPCRICHVYDGDTVHAVIDFKGDATRIICRLYGINTPEMNEGEKAFRARNRVIQLLTDVTIDLDDMTSSKKREFVDRIHQNKKIVYVSLCGRDKYGRELAVFYDNDLSINDILINENHCVAYMIHK